MTGKADKLMIEITEINGKYLLLKNNERKESSDVMIRQAGQGSNCYLIYLQPNSFIIYNALIDKYVGGSSRTTAKVFSEISEYSNTTKTFVAKGYNEATDSFLYLIVNDNGSFIEQNFLFVSDEKENIRYVQLSTGKWIYFDCERMTFCWDKNKAYNRPLGRRVKGFGTMYINSKSKILWTYNKDYAKFIPLFSLRFYDFIDIENTRFFLGCNMYKETSGQERYSYRILTKNDEGGVVGSDELYTEYSYLPDKNMFIVRASAGWTLIAYNKKEESFYNVADMPYYSSNKFSFIQDLIIVTKEDGNVDIYDKDSGLLYTVYWRTVSIVCNDDNWNLECFDFKGKYETFSLDDLKTKYDTINSQLREKYKTIDNHIVDISSQEQYKEEDMSIEYYYIGALKSSFNNKILTSKIDETYDGEISQGTYIAYLDNANRTLYILKYIHQNAFKLVSSKEVDMTDYELFKDVEECPLKSIGKGIPENEVMRYLRNNYKRNSSYDDEQLTVDLSDSDEESANNEPHGEESGNTFLKEMTDSYKYLPSLKNTSNIIDAMYLLFKDKIDLLYGVDTFLNKKLDELFDKSGRDEALRDKSLELIKADGNFTENEINRYTISLDYHSYIKGLSFMEAYQSVCTDLPEFKNISSELDEYVHTIITEEMNSKTDMVKSIIRYAVNL